MERCAKLLLDSSGNITKVLSEINCSPESITVYPNWFLWVVASVVLFLVWVIWIGPKWRVWAQEKQGEADLAQAHREQQITVAKAQGRLDAANKNKDAAIIEAEAVSEQIKAIGANLKEHDLFLKWQWTEMMREKPSGSVIYVPTEAGLPILEAGKR